jgi:hypothetical protein
VDIMRERNKKFRTTIIRSSEQPPRWQISILCVFWKLASSVPGEN